MREQLKVGDKVRIRRAINATYGFEEGEEVLIMELFDKHHKRDCHYRAENAEDYWYICDSDIH